MRDSDCSILSSQVTTFIGDEDGILIISLMAALLGRIDPFDPDREDWPQYVERLNQFFEANDLTGVDKATKRCATFLTVIRAAPYKLLRSLLSLAKPTDKPFEELVAKLTDYYSPKPSEVMQRFRFNACLSATATTGIP